MSAALWIRTAQRGIAALDSARGAALLAARLYVAQVFFSAGLTKLRDWDTTLALFADEYHVPLLPPAVAAVAGTAGELVLPLLLALGLGGLQLWLSGQWLRRYRQGPVEWLLRRLVYGRR